MWGYARELWWGVDCTGCKTGGLSVVMWYSIKAFTVFVNTRFAFAQIPAPRPAQGVSAGGAELSHRHPRLPHVACRLP
jgi:hypothetical protein